MPNPAQIDAVVVSYNSGDTLRDCVEPLTHIEGVTVTVVDNASPAEDPLATIADLPVTAIRADRNGGFSYGCNLGAARGSAPYVLLLNPDGRIDRGSVAALAAVLDADPSAGIVGPKILGEDGELHHSQRYFPHVGSTVGQALFLHRAFPRARWADEMMRDARAYDRPGRPDWLSGACMLVRRSALEAIGGFDEGFFLYCEDTDLCRRLSDAGWGVCFEPAAVARHEGGVSAPRTSLQAVLAASRVRYARKHSSRGSAALETVVIALHELTHTLVNLPRASKARGHARALRAVVSPSRSPEVVV
jgi:GT2 family glycosyltransferase